MLSQSAQRVVRPARRKSVPVAVILTCIPMLGAASCASMGATDQHGGIPELFWFSTLFWGAGYLYLKRYKRFIVVFLLGPLFAFSSCTASESGVSYDFEHPYRTTTAQDIESADRASYQEALIIAGSVALLAVDVWRLAAINNAAVEAVESEETDVEDEETGAEPEGTDVEDEAARD